MPEQTAGQTPEQAGGLLSGLSSEQQLRFLMGGTFAEGGDLIEELQKVEIESLAEAAEEALAFRDGLLYGKEDYDLDNPETLFDLQNLFTSSEGMRERPNFPNYPMYRDAISVTVQERVRREVRSMKSKAKIEKRQLGPEEKKKISELKRLESHMEGRKIIDRAFMERTKYCEEAEAVSRLLGPEFAKPDKSDWQAALWGEFGGKVELALREIVRVGKETDIYAQGFIDAKTFKNWLGPLVEKTEGRMDAVWFAWRLALLWELPAQFGCKIDKRGQWKIADPPIGNDLFTWSMHFEKKRALEWGFDASGKRVRESRYLTHSGYPLSLGKISPNGFCNSYLHEAKVDLNGKRVTLFELWWDKGMKIGGKFGEDENLIPWNLTEMQPRGLDTDELPPGSFGLWRLRCLRAYLFSRYVRGEVTLSDVLKVNFFSDMLRTCEKVGIGPDERAEYLLALLAAHHPKRTARIPAFKEKPELLYRTYSAREVWDEGMRGDLEFKGFSIEDILENAYQPRFINEKGINKICQALNIKRPMLGPRATN